MKRVAYLCSRNMLPDGEDLRSDAFELGLLRQALTAPFAARGMELVCVAWDGEQVLPADAVLIGATWDYWDHHDAFLRRLATIQETTPLFNSAELVRWNSDKRYLRELAAGGAPSIPTCWLQPGDDLAACFDALRTDCVVAKRQVGAGAFGQHRLRRGEPLPAWDKPLLVQPYLPAIVSHGEVSVVVVDGAISHALLKRPASGDYRIQSMYGGVETPFTLSSEHREVVERVLALVPDDPVYARVDLLPVDGEMAVMEVELIEPYLYPEQGPELGERLARAVERRL